MVKKNLSIFILFILVVSACQNVPQTPQATVTSYDLVETETLLSEVDTATPAIEDTPTSVETATAIPEYAILEPDTLNRLQQVASATVQSPVSISWSADSQKIGVLSVSGFSIYSAENGALLKSITLSDPYRLLDASISREEVAVTTDQQTVEFRSMDTGDVVSSFTTDELFLSGSFSPDGFEFITTSGYSITAQIWDIETGQLVNTVEGFETAAPVYNARYNDQGTGLIWTARATVQVYDLQSGQFGAVMGHEEFVSSSDLAPNGRLLAAAAAGTIDGDYQPLIRLWDAFGGQILGDLQNGDSIANHVHFSPDGTMLLVAENADASIWSVQDQTRIWQLPAQGSSIRDARFAPDRKAIVTVADDGNLLILRVIK